MRLCRGFLVLFTIALAPAVLAQTPATGPGQGFPGRPIQLIASAAGGGSDFAARLLAQGLGPALGQSAVVVNRPGPATIPAMAVSKSPPDGHTLLAVGGNLFWLLQFLQNDVPYDPIRDFAPVSLTASTPNVVAVHPSLPVKNPRELIALANKNPGTLNASVSNAGGSPHLAAELFKVMSKTNFVIVRYNGVAPGMTALAAGEVHMGFPTVSSATPHAQSGRIRILAVTSLKPSALAPGVPTLHESGLPGYESASQYVVFAPARTPANIIEQLNRAIVQFMNQPDTRQKYFNAGLDVIASSPQELTVAMKADMDRMGKIIRDAGIRAQ